MIRLRITQEAVCSIFTANKSMLIDGLPYDCGDCISTKMSPTGVIEFMFNDGKTEIVDKILTYAAATQTDF